MNNKAEYTPEKVVDISNLSREDWLEYRKKGIGGSDVAAIMGISPFATIRDLFYNKTGVQPVIQEEEESNWVAKEVGHRLEDLVAEIFSKKTGLEVFPVRVMFRHPLYLLALKVLISRRRHHCQTSDLNQQLLVLKETQWKLHPFDSRQVLL